MLPRTLRLCACALLAALFAALLPGTAQAAERTIAGGRLDWGVKSSFQTYITGPIAQGSWSLNGGASTVGQSQFRFHSAQGTYDPDSGAFTARYQGGVRFTGHQEADGNLQLDLTISNPSVSVSGGSGTLYADMRSKDRESGAITDSRQVPLASLDLGGIDLRGGTGIAVTGIPATLTAEGAVAFAGYYAAGDALDPVTLSADSTAPEPAEPTQDPTDEPPADTGEDEEEPGGEAAFATAAVDWGVRRTFREYVSGTIAQGGWELGDGAEDGGAVFRFPEGEGTADPEAGTLDAAFAGTVTFTGTDLDLTLGGVTVTVADGTGTLAADVTTGGDTAEDRPLVTFPAATDALTPDDGLLLLAEVPATLTEEGAEAFGGLYQAGAAMDPLTLAVALDDGAELPALPDLGSDPVDAQAPEPTPTDDPAPAATDTENASEDTGGTPVALIATGVGALLVLAAAAVTLTRRSRRAPRVATTPEENDPS
ncbi:HtaA domain-containing protein [Streptomyces avicenniae]|uniref:HtaA domain-containing protein n=1 Tax=Streptomyces avicenniae TaxID=500153 RepID=UPI00069C0B98|nr:HtaA domain-containing protein [Streptomyces avicenniae]